MSNILPIGTVININGKSDKLIIVGRVKVEDVYKYACVPYPYGYVDVKDFIYVNDKEIYAIVFLGDINY